MSDRYGLLIAEDGQTIRTGRNKVDSRRRTLILDLEADPAHMRIVELLGGNTYTDSGGTGRTKDILSTFEHKLGFTPLVDCYFYVETVDGLTVDAAVGGYANGFYPLSGTGNTVADIVSFEANSTNFDLVHYFDKFGGATGYVSPADRYKFRVKIYIYSIDIGRAVNYGYGLDGDGNVIP